MRGHDESVPTLPGFFGAGTDTLAIHLEFVHMAASLAVGCIGWRRWRSLGGFSHCLVTAVPFATGSRLLNLDECSAFI